MRTVHPAAANTDLDIDADTHTVTLKRVGGAPAAV